MVVRFPLEERTGAGYHIEGSYPGPAGQRQWVGTHSLARGQLALFLFSDVSPMTRPARLVCGSHVAVSEFLAPYGEDGAYPDAGSWYPSTLCVPAAHVVGTAGDVSLCHPLVVHSATWPHRGTGPPMTPSPPCMPLQADHGPHGPVPSHQPRNRRRPCPR